MFTALFKFSSVTNKLYAYIHLKIFQDQYAWNKLVLDNLLRFASTPKGVDLLYKSGSMESCISYMFNERYSKGLQMSKCEKFGYGALVSQVSVTSPGMQALYNSKLIKSLFEDLKTLLELQNSPCANISVADNTHTTTGPHSISKTLSNIFKVISSFNGLRTIVENDMVLLNPVYKELGAKRSTPDSKLLRSGWEFTFGGFIYKFALMDRRFLLRLESSFEESRLVKRKRNFLNENEKLSGSKFFN